MAVGNFDLKIPTKNISSVNPLVFSEFLVVGLRNSHHEETSMQFLFVGSLWRTCIRGIFEFNSLSHSHTD